MEFSRNQTRACQIKTQNMSSHICYTSLFQLLSSVYFWRLWLSSTCFISLTINSRLLPVDWAAFLHKQTSPKVSDVNCYLLLANETRTSSQTWCLLQLLMARNQMWYHPTTLSTLATSRRVSTAASHNVMKYFTCPLSQQHEIHDPSSQLPTTSKWWLFSRQKKSLIFPVTSRSNR